MGELRTPPRMFKWRAWKWGGGHVASLPGPSRRRAIGPPHNPTHTLTEAQFGRPEALIVDLVAIKNAHSKSASIPDDRISDSASLLVRYGIATPEAFRNTDEQARRFLFEESENPNILTFGSSAFFA